MKHSYLRILGNSPPQENASFYEDEDNFNESQQIEQIRLELKKLYFQKRTILVNTFIEIFNDNQKSTDQIQKLELPENIQKQREQYFTIKQKLNKLNSKQTNNNDLSVSQEEPFNKVKQRIFNKHKLKRKYFEQMRHKDLIEDSLKVQRKIILDIYKKKLKEFYKLDDQMQPDQNNYHKHSNTFQKGSQSSYTNRKNIRFLQKENNFKYASHNENQDNFQMKSNKGFVDANKESIVVENLKNPNTANFMKINDPNISLDESMSHKNPQSVGYLINEFAQNDTQFLSKEKSHKLNASFQQSGYMNYLNQQKKQLQDQKKRMLKLTDQANRVISNQTLTDSEEEVQTVHNQFDQQKNNTFSQRQDLADGLSEQISQIKCLFAETIDLFIVSEVLKFQLQNRTFQMISKLFQMASIEYKQRIQLQESISSTTFTLAIKSLLKDNYEERSQFDFIVNKIFKGNTVLQFQQFTQQFKSVLTKKEVQMFQPFDNKNQVDRTIQKAKRLFLTWFSVNYFQKRIKQILRKNQLIVTTIMKQCAQNSDFDCFDPILLEEFFCEGNNSNVKRTKMDIYFKHILGKQLKRKKFIEWYSINNENIFSKRYQRKGAKLNPQKQE